jgi:hypothetical protein
MDSKQQECKQSDVATQTQPQHTLSRRTAIASMVGAGTVLMATHAMTSQVLAQPGTLPPSKSLGGPKDTSVDLGGWDAAKGEFVLPALPYAFKALEPQIDAQGPHPVGQAGEDR